MLHMLQGCHQSSAGCTVHGLVSVHSSQGAITKVPCISRDSAPGAGAMLLAVWLICPADCILVCQQLVTTPQDGLVAALGKVDYTSNRAVLFVIGCVCVTLLTTPVSHCDGCGLPVASPQRQFSTIRCCHFIRKHMYLDCSYMT